VEEGDDNPKERIVLRNFDCGIVWKKVTIIERRELWCRICSCLLPSLISALSLSLSRSSLNTFGHPLLSCALLLHLLLSGIDIQASHLYAYFEDSFVIEEVFF
jgi:hypothetical protein